MGTLKYSSNNSGGGWWLSDSDWCALEAEGWTVAWVRNEDPDGELSRNRKGEGRWLGALATRAQKEFPSADEGVEEWVRVTGQDASDEGCNCCGKPHDFEFVDDDGKTQYLSLVSRGNDVEWS